MVIGIVVSLAALCAVIQLAVAVVYRRLFRKVVNTSIYIRYEDAADYKCRRVNFMSGKNRLTGYLYGEENDKGLIVLAHGISDSAEGYLSKTLFFADHGWRVFTYDCTGCGASEGSSMRGLPQSAVDLNAALTYIESQDWNLPILLYGHSWGGYAATAVLNRRHNIAAVVSVSGFNNPSEMMAEGLRGMMGRAALIFYPFAWVCQRVLFGSAAGMTAVCGINKSGIPVMVIHGREDSVIRYDGAAIIAHKDQITNPNVAYKTCDEKGQNGHLNLFRSKEALAYAAGLETGENPNIDRFLASGLDAGFMGEVNAFFETHTAKQQIVSQ